MIWRRELARWAASKPHVSQQWQGENPRPSTLPSDGTLIFAAAPRIPVPLSVRRVRPRFTNKRHAIQQGLSYPLPFSDADGEVLLVHSTAGAQGVAVLRQAMDVGLVQRYPRESERSGSDRQPSLMGEPQHFPYKVATLMNSPTIFGAVRGTLGPFSTNRLRPVAEAHARPPRRSRLRKCAIEPK